jgi:hypothetical protein
MLPSTSLGSWWMAHLQLPGYDPIATAGACRFDIRAAEQALVFCTQALHLLLSPWEEAILLNLWGWRHADGRRRYVTVYAEPYRHDALAVWCATLALWLLRAAPRVGHRRWSSRMPRRPSRRTSISRWRRLSRGNSRYAALSCSIPDPRRWGHPQEAGSPSSTPRRSCQAKCCCVGKTASPWPWR